MLVLLLAAALVAAGCQRRTGWPRHRQSRRNYTHRRNPMLPHGGNLFREKVPAAIFVENGFGKLMGSTQVNELGELETPIVLTSTLSVPRAADALLDYMLAAPRLSAAPKAVTARPRDFYAR